VAEIALVAACVAMVLSAVLPLMLSDRTLRSAFNTLEDDFETLRQSVRSDLGRVSRLKRSIMRGEIPAQEGAEPEVASESNGDGSLSALSKRHLEIQRKIMSRRHSV